ncbi:MAG TPA: AsmA family protein, partial [Candidatus Omnitrophota bacterium]|nr:AsmA family protein [Candidatus Omnitrophota bacterium]
MKKFFKFLKFLGIVLLVLVVVFLVFRDIIVKTGAQVAVKAMTGLSLEVDKLHIGLLSTKLDIENLKIKNPDGFPDPLMVDLPKIYVDYALKDIIAGNIHLNDMKFFLTEVTIVKLADGRSNLDGIMKLASKKKAPAEKEAKPEPAKAKKPLKFQFDLVEIKVGKFVTKSYDQAGKASVDTFNVGFDKRYENVTDFTVISADIAKYTGKFLLQAAMNLDLGDASEAIKGSLNTLTNLGTG